MGVRGLIGDINKLRCNACQDFLKMIVLPNWQENLFKAVKTKIDNKEYAEKYKDAYCRMRDIGYENYTIDEMDISFIAQILIYLPNCDIVSALDSRTIYAFRKIKDDRNAVDHSCENEDTEELYIRAISEIRCIQDFVRTVDDNEHSIPEDQREAYRKEYIQKCEDIKKRVRKAFGESNGWLFAIEKDISKILNSKDDERVNAWLDKFLQYTKDWSNKKIAFDPEYKAFLVMSSDAGIQEAYFSTIDYILTVEKNVSEAIQKIKQYYTGDVKLPISDAKFFVEALNNYILKNADVITDDVINAVEAIRSCGYNIVIENGRIQLI